MSPAIRGCILFPATLADIEAQATVLLKRDAVASGTFPSAVRYSPRPAPAVEHLDHQDTPPPVRGETRPIRLRGFALAHMPVSVFATIAPRFRRIARWRSASRG